MLRTLALLHKAFTHAVLATKKIQLLFFYMADLDNCVNFEATTAQRLADKGFYVIVYDRRGEGRSADPKASFNFKETNDDINQLYQQYGIQQAMLIAHSFGGLVATMYASQFPEKVKSIVMVGAPVSLQETFRTIQKSVQRIYEEKRYGKS